MRTAVSRFDAPRAEVVDCRVPNEELNGLRAAFEGNGFELGETTVTSDNRKIQLSSVRSADAEVLLLYLRPEAVESGTLPVRDALLTFSEGKHVFAVAAGGARLGSSIKTKLRMWEKGGVPAGELQLADLVDAAAEPDAGAQIALLLRLPAPGEAARDRVFVSFHPDDGAWYDRFELYLNDFETWSTRDISTGGSITEELEAAIAATKVAVLLVTQRFLASKELERELLNRFCDAADQKVLTLFWVAVESSTWERTKLNDLQAFNDDRDKPLALLEEGARGEELVRFSREIWTLMHPTTEEEP